MGLNKAWSSGEGQLTNYTEQPVVIVSKEKTAQIWAGAKIMYSGFCSGPTSIGQASGYCYLSGENDVSPINASGWGSIRVPELANVHAAVIVPKAPCIQAAVNYTAGQQSGHAKSGIGGISGNVMLVHYCNTCTAPAAAWSGLPCWQGSGLNPFNSGLVDIFAFGSKY